MAELGVEAPLKAVTAVTAVKAVTAATTSAERPNMVVVMADDMRADDLRFMPRVRRLLVARGLTYGTASARIRCAVPPGRRS